MQIGKILNYLWFFKKLKEKKEQRSIENISEIDKNKKEDKNK
jgi:hypothetical protein